MASARTREAKALLIIALPLIFAYVADVLMVVTAKMVVGRLGYLELAAAGISTDMSYQMCIVLMGFFSVVGVLVSGALGAGRRQEVMPSLWRGLLLAGVLGVVVTVIVLNLDAVLRLARQDAEVIRLSSPFYQSFAFAMLPIIWFGVLRSFVSALMRTGFVMAITMVTVVLNYGLMQGLVHGDFGLPNLGLAGAGIAWSISMWFKFLCLAAYTAWLVRRENFSADAGWIPSGVKSFIPLIALGLPVAGIAALESGLFAATALLSGMIGPRDLAAYQVVMGWISIPFVISLGLAEAAMVRVAYWMGAEDGAAARRAGNLGMLIGVSIPLVLVMMPLFAPELITQVFLDVKDPGYGEIAALVSGLLLIAAIFQVFDGLQVIASHALRGLRDASMPLLIAGTGYWIIGLGSAYVMAFIFGWGSRGLWWGLAVGLCFTASLLAWRFERLARSVYFSSPSDPSSK
jgi:multidrug resistance protein, MATE family